MTGYKGKKKKDKKKRLIIRHMCITLSLTLFKIAGSGVSGETDG